MASETASNEPYVIEERLGAGAMGVVYRAFDRARGEPVALKMLRAFDPGALYRFKQEFRPLAGIGHRNLVRLHELVSSGDRWFFTMELVDGVDFLTHVRGTVSAEAEQDEPTQPPQGTPRPTTIDTTATAETPLRARAPRTRAALAPRALDEEQTARLRAALLQLATGVVVLHDAARLHRDLKPSNVLVARDGRVVILDFGVATELQPEDQPSGAHIEIVGTPAYMAPELASSDVAVREASDWYSVGVMLYEALIGRPPFRGPLDRVMEAKRSIDPRPPSELAPGVPEDLEALCLALLARDPALRPSGREVIERLGGRSAHVPLRHARFAALVGRGRQLTALAQALARTRKGEAVTAFVHGSSGMGKSALVAHFIADQRSARIALGLVGRCYERESVPYKALDSLVDSIYRHLADLPRAEIARLLPPGIYSLARLFPVLRRLEAVLGMPWLQLPTSDPHEIRRRAVAALRELLVRMAEREPLVLHIDDVQWGDADSAELLSDVLRQPGAPPLLLIASYRSEDERSSPFLAALATSPEHTVEIAVRRLPLEDARSLASALLVGDGPRPRVAEAIARESGGSPFFVNELVAFAATHDGASARLGEVLGSRLAALPLGARRLLDVVALAAGPLRQSAALTASDLGEGGRAALDLLRDAHLIYTRGADEQDVVETYHDRIREAVFAAMDEEHRRMTHARLARALLGEGGQEELVAFHFERADDPLRAAEHYLLAADHAADIVAFARAARLYRRALALKPLAGLAESNVLARLADAESHSGRPNVAVELYSQAAQNAPRPEAMRLYGRAVEELLRAARVDDGIAALREFLPALGVRLPRRILPSLGLARARVRLNLVRAREHDADGNVSVARITRLEIYWTAAAALGLSDHVLGALFQAWHYLDAVESGDRRHASRAYSLEAIFTALRGVRHRARAERILAHAGELAASTGDVLTVALVHAAAGIAAYQFCEWQRTDEAATHSARMLREALSGSWWHINCVDMYTLWSSYHQGRVRDMSRRAAELLRGAEERGDLFAATMISSGLSNFAWLVRGDLEGARAVSAAALSRWPKERYLLQHNWDLQAQTNNDLYAGDAQAAWRRINEHLPRMQRAHLLGIELNRVEAMNMRGRAAVAAAAAGHDRERLLRIADRDAAALLTERSPMAQATAPMTRAAVAYLRGDQRAAVRWLEQAVARTMLLGMMLHAAVARRRLGRLVGGDAGVALLAEADAWMAEQEIVDRDRVTEVFAPGFGD